MINKSLFKIKDSEVPLLMKRIHERFEELDNLVVIEKSNFDSKKQSAFMMKIQPYKKEPKNINVVVNRKSIEEQSSKIDQIKALLSGGKKVKQAILIKIIEDLENNE